ncbi:MAG: 50S ribosomal protein L22 [Anaerolineaceae bacterium]|jgi:large subunit ribosomal protein L22|nr:MAG: 50S ribosomal protein L22 [Anaerolineaceae bacterium]
MDVRAELKNCPISPQKVRLVIDVVRGQKVEKAITDLRFLHKAASEPICKLIESAAANAENNFGLDRGNLFISEIYADEAPTRKWRRFGARGRFKPVLRRSSHVKIVLQEKA